MDNFRKAPLGYILYVTGYLTVLLALYVLAHPTEGCLDFLVKIFASGWMIHSSIQVIRISKEEIRNRKEADSGRSQ